MDYEMEWLLAKTQRLELQKDQYKEQRDFYKGKVKELDSLLHVYLSLIEESDKSRVMKELLLLLEGISQQAHIMPCKVQVFPGGTESTIQYTPVVKKGD